MLKNKIETIAQVAREGLCTGCGTCAGVCPREAIEMQVIQGVYLPKIDWRKCTRCGLCFKCCPGLSMNFELLNKKVFGMQPDDKLLGNYVRCYVGHSTDHEIRYNSSSGGVVTQLLIFALEENLIDGALVTCMKKSDPLKPKPFIARTRRDIISASKSKYCPVAANEALKNIRKEKGRFAVVGLPCHIHGIRKAEENVKALKEKIVLHLGLMCSHTVSFFGTELLLKKLGVAQEQVAEINYRGKGWPGSMLIKLKNHSSVSIPYISGWNAYWPVFSCFFFTPKRCLICPDQTNELADISVGDAWLPELKNERIGKSIIVARTIKGEEILKFACSSKVLSLKSIECEKVKRSQREPLRFKKNDIGIRAAMIGYSGEKIPPFSRLQNSSYSFSSWARNFWALINVRASEYKVFKQFLTYIPFPVIKLYYGVYKFLSFI